MHSVTFLRSLLPVSDSAVMLSCHDCLHVPWLSFPCSFKLLLCMQLSDESNGVIGLKWKEVSCDK